MKFEKGKMEFPLYRDGKLLSRKTVEGLRYGPVFVHNQSTHVWVVSHYASGLRFAVTSDRSMAKEIAKEAARRFEGLLSIEDAKALKRDRRFERFKKWSRAFWDHNPAPGVTMTWNGKRK